MALYANGDAWTGTAAGAGTEASPYTSLATVVALGAAALAGQTVYLTGTFRPANGAAVALSNLSGVTFQCWPGMPTPVVRGDYPILPSAWSLTAGTTYRVNIGDVTAVIPAGANANARLHAWDGDRIGTDGREYGEFKKAAALVGVGVNEVAAGESFYDGTTWLYVSCTDGTSPATNGRTVSYGKGGNGFEFDNSTGVTVGGSTSVGIIFKRWCDTNSGNGYGVRMQISTRARIIGNRFIYCGFHSLGTVGDGNVDCCIADNECWGLMYDRVGTGGSAMIAIYTGSGDLTGANCYGNKLYQFSSLDGAGNQVDPDTNPTTMQRVAGIITHTGGGGNGNLVDVKVYRNYFKCYMGTGGGFTFSTPSGTESGVALVDADDATQFPVRFWDNIIDGGDSFVVNVNTSFVNNKCDFRRKAVTGGSVNSNMAIGTAGITVHLQGNTIWTNTEDQASSSVIRQNAASINVVMWNNTIYNESATPAGNMGIVRYAAASCTTKMRQNVIVFKTANSAHRLFSGTAATASSQYDCVDNWYHNIRTGASGYSPLAACDTQAEWATVVDTTGIYDVLPLFNDSANGDFGPVPGGNLHETRKNVNNAARLVAMTGHAYNGQYGAIPLQSHPTIVPPSRKLRYPSMLPV